MWIQDYVIFVEAVNIATLDEVGLGCKFHESLLFSLIRVIGLARL